MYLGRAGINTWESCLARALEEPLPLHKGVEGACLDSGTVMRAPRDTGFKPVVDNPNCDDVVVGDEVDVAACCYLGGNLKMLHNTDLTSCCIIRTID